MTKTSYSGMTTKVKALYGNLLDDKRYEEIISITSVSDFVIYLRDNTSYRKAFQNADSLILHRGEIERFLTTGVYEDFKKIYRFADKHQRHFLNLYFQSFEIEILKKCVRNVFSDKPSDLFLPIVDDFFISHTSLDINQLLAAKTPGELWEATKGTDYYRLFNVDMECNINQLFDYDIALDMFYYKSIWRTLTKKSSGVDAAILTNCYGMRIDLLNLSWIYRAKFIYRLNNTKLLDVIIPCNYKLKQKEILKLLEAEDIEDFNQLLLLTYYGRHFGLDNAAKLNQSYDYLLEHLSHKTAKNNPYSIATVHAYLIQKEMERDRLTRILECIRYGLDQKQIKDYINGGSF